VKDDQRKENHQMFRVLLSAVASLFFVACRPSPPPADSPSEPAMRWWKGNLHTHSFWSDSDDYPETILEKYKSAGYDFVALSEHNTLAEGERWIDIEENGGEELLADYLGRFGEEWVEVKEEDGKTLVRLKTLEEYRALLEDEGAFLLIQAEEITFSRASPSTSTPRISSSSSSLVEVGAYATSCRTTWMRSSSSESAPDGPCSPTSITRTSAGRSRSKT
jgi:hypothetical protein